MGLKQYYAKFNDNSYLRHTSPNPETKSLYPDRTSRSVTSGHYVLSVPTPLPDPVMLSCSKDVMKKLGISKEMMESNDMLRYLSGNIPKDINTWATPYALSIYGRPVTDNCPYRNDTGYGDGRAHSIGEFVVDGKRLEIQLKGSGTTPFSRGGDGKAVLRSSIREYLVSEAMHWLNIPTTRALSLCISATERVDREWYPDNEKNSNQTNVQIETKSNPTAIVARVSESFLRVGHVELFSRRVQKNKTIESLQALDQLFRHIVFREYPEFIDMNPDDQVLSVLSRFAERLITMVTGWLRVGYVQSNFNSDNCLVSGRTMDYGPFGFMEKYDPQKNFWAGSGSHFAFINQMNAAKANYVVFARALEPLMQNKCINLEQISSKFDILSSQSISTMWMQKLGLVELGWTRTVENILERLLELMQSVDVDYTIFWRQLSDIPLLLKVGKESSKAYLRSIQQHLTKAFYVPVLNDGWIRWIDDYCSVLSTLVTDPGTISTEGKLCSKQMKTHSPKYVPREWMLARAYKDAENNSFEMLYELENLFKKPYDEQYEMESKYYVLTPLHIVTNTPGISSMTCSS